MEKNNKKVIFTVTEPEDLYIIGDWPYDKGNVIENKIAALYGDRFVMITDDYATLYIKGKARKDFTIGCETIGTFLLLTKSEWAVVRPWFEESDEFSFDELHDEPYAMVVRDYVGEVAVDLLDEAGNSYLPDTFEQTNDISAQRLDSADDVYTMEVVLLESGFRASAIMLQTLYGFELQTERDRDTVFIDIDTGEEHICKLKDAIDKRWEERGKREIITTRWIKKD